MMLTALIGESVHSQDQNPGFLFEYGTWAVLQAVPSPVFFHDGNADESRLQFGLRWNVSPVNYSLKANPLVSKFQFFKVNPVRRYAGSAELFFQPEWALGPYRFAGLERFNFASGLRLYVPAIESGEYLALSVGGKVKTTKSESGETVNNASAEIGAYTLFGTLGFQFNYNFNSRNRYDFGLWLKYY